MQVTKIIQIIPAPVGMYAEFKGEDGEENFKCPVIVLKLMQTLDGFRYIEPVTFDSDALFECPTEAINFLRYGYTLDEKMNPTLSFGKEHL